MRISIHELLGPKRSQALATHPTSTDLVPLSCSTSFTFPNTPAFALTQHTNMSDSLAFTSSKDNTIVLPHQYLTKGERVKYSTYSLDDCGKSSNMVYWLDCSFWADNLIRSIETTTKTYNIAVPCTDTFLGAEDNLLFLHDKPDLLACLAAREKSIAMSLLYIQAFPQILHDPPASRNRWRETFGVPVENVGSIVITEQLLESVGYDERPELSKILGALQDWRYQTDSAYRLAESQAYDKINRSQRSLIPVPTPIALSSELSGLQDASKKRLKRYRDALQELETITKHHRVHTNTHPLISYGCSMDAWIANHAKESSIFHTPAMWQDFHWQVEGSVPVCQIVLERGSPPSNA